MKKILIFLASAVVLTSYAQSNSSGGSSGRTGSSTSNNRTTSNNTGSNTGSGSTGRSTTSGSTGRNTSSGTTSGTTSTSSTNQLRFDQVFLQRATADSLEEVVLGGIAETNSQNTDIQSFGALLVTNHTDSIVQAQQLATTLGITLPTTLNTNQQQEVQRLSTLTGVSFDRAFIAAMITNHIKDIRLFEVAAVIAQNADVRAYARDQLPILMNHLVTALQIRETLLPSTQTAGATPNATATGGSASTGGTGSGGSANTSGTGGGGTASASASAADP